MYPISCDTLLSNLRAGVKIIIMYVTSFYSISYYSNMRLISKTLLEQRHLLYTFRYPCFNSQASLHSFPFQATQHKQILLGKEHEWFKTVYQIEIPDPYSQSNGRQNQARQWSCPFNPSITCIVKVKGALKTSHFSFMFLVLVPIQSKNQAIYPSHYSL